MSQDLFTDSQLFATQDSVINGHNSDGDEDEDEEEETDPPFSQLSPSDLKNRKNGNKLLSTDLPKEVISKHKQVFVEIQQKTKEAENVSDICKSVKVLSEQIQRQDKYYKSGGVNELMTLDAKAISENTSITARLVKNLQTDSKQFDSTEFAEKLLTALNVNQIDDRSDPNDTFRVDIIDWVEFGRNLCQFHRVLPKLDFIHGSFDSSNQTPQQKQSKPRVQHPKPVLSEQTQATQIDPNSKTTEDSTPQEVELILKTVKKLEAKNSSLPFIDVIVNPNSMPETVENIFHSSFLVKDGLARVLPDEDGLPSIASIDNSDVVVAEPEKGLQSVFSFSMKDWKYWIERFDIKKPAIRHQKKASQKK